MFITRRICIARDEKAVEVYVALEASDNTVEPEGELTPEDDTANRYSSLRGGMGGWSFNGPREEVGSCTALEIYGKRIGRKEEALVDV